MSTTEHFLDTIKRVSADKAARGPRPGAQIVPGPNGCYLVHNAHAGWGHGYLDADGNVTSTPTPMTYAEAVVVSTQARAQADIDDTEPSTDTCPLHGADCPTWALLGASS